MRTLFAIFAGSLLVASSVVPQVHREEITVEAVDVPVYVFSKGKPVRDLTKEDFELSVNGRPQPIDYFDRIDFEAGVPAAAGAENAPQPVRDPRERRLFLLLFDLVYNRPAALARARDAAVTMIDHALPEDFFAVATFSSTGARFISSFTRDHDVLRHAVISLSPSGAHDSLAISITDAERQSAETWQPVSDGSGRGGGEDPVKEILALGAIAEKERAKALARDQLGDFSEIARRLGQLEGYKHVILFSESFSSYWMSGASPQPGFGVVPDVDQRLLDSFQSMVRSFRAAGALLHTVDLGVRDASSADPLSNETLHMFAAQTGGQFIHNTNDFTGALADLSATCSVAYRLGFRPVNPRRGDNTIEVRLKSAPSGTTISYRKGFSTTRERPAGVDPLLLADVIQNDIPQTGTPPVIAFGEGPVVGVVVPAPQLAREFGAISEASVLLYVFDDKGAAVMSAAKQIPIPARPAGDIVLRQKLALPPGKYVAKALLTVGTSIGFKKTPFTLSVKR